MNTRFDIRKLIPTWLLLVVGLSWETPLRAAPNIKAQRLLQLGQYGNASADIRKQLEANPDDADLHAMAGTVFSKAGLYNEALAPFLFADGSILYEGEGLYEHANTLRETGRPDLAAALRNERLVSSDIDQGQELIVSLALADDWIRQGDFSEAYDVLMGLLAMWPRSPALHGHIADLYLDMGDLDSAEYHLWYVNEFLGYKLGMRGLFAQFRIHLHNGDFVAAQSVLNEGLRLRRQSLPLRARQAELYRLQGDPTHAAESLQLKRYWFQEHPEFNAVLALALWETGKSEEAAELARRIREIYPNHPAVGELGNLLRLGGR